MVACHEHYGKSQVASGCIDMYTPVYIFRFNKKALYFIMQKESQQYMRQLNEK